MHSKMHYETSWRHLSLHISLLRLSLNNYFPSFHIVCEKPHDNGSQRNGRSRGKTKIVDRCQGNGANRPSWVDGRGLRGGRRTVWRYRGRGWGEGCPLDLQRETGRGQDRDTDCVFRPGHWISKPSRGLRDQRKDIYRLRGAGGYTNRVPDREVPLHLLPRSWHLGPSAHATPERRKVAARRLYLQVQKSTINWRTFLCVSPPLFQRSWQSDLSADVVVTIQSLGTDREAEPRGFWTGRIRHWHKI